jgi:hypothetical protein
MITELESRIEKSLDVIDVSYSEISDILNLPIFHDDIVIKRVMKSIINARDSLLHIANVMALTDKQKSKKDEEDEKCKRQRGHRLYGTIRLPLPSPV